MYRVSAKVCYEKQAKGQDEADFENCTQSPTLALGCSILHPGAPTASEPAHELKLSRHRSFQKPVQRHPEDGRLELGSRPESLGPPRRCSEFRPFAVLEAASNNSPCPANVEAPR